VFVTNIDPIFIVLFLTKTYSLTMFVLIVRHIIFVFSLPGTFSLLYYLEASKILLLVQIILTLGDENL